MTTIRVFNFIPSAEPNDNRTKMCTTTMKIDRSAWESDVEHCQFGVAFDDTIHDCGNLKNAIDELKRDSQQMYGALKMTEMSITYPANLEGAEFEKFRSEIQSGIPSVKLIFKKSDWIHTARGWVKVSSLPVVDAAPMICSSSEIKPITSVDSVNVQKSFAPYTGTIKTVASFRDALRDKKSLVDAVNEIKLEIELAEKVCPTGNLTIEYPANFSDPEEVKKLVLPPGWTKPVMMVELKYLWTNLGWIEAP